MEPGEPPVSSSDVVIATTASPSPPPLPLLPPPRRASIVATLAANAAKENDFYQTFGWLGVPMVVAFSCSAATLLYMAVVQVFRRQVANMLMSTADLDQGDFWLLLDPPLALVVVATVMLVGFALCYIALVLFMVFFRGYALRHLATQVRNAAAANTKAHHVVDETSAKMPPQRARKSFYQELTGLHGAYHAYYNALYDLPKLVFQTAAISTYLAEGFPMPLIYLYMFMLMTNWLISFYRFQRHAEDKNLVISRCFYLFDLFFAVFAPIIVLAYAYNQFHMDREVFAIRQQTLSPGSYDRIARLFADPVAVDIFRYGFRHLQLTKTWYVAGKCVLNGLAVYKWKKMIVFLITQRHLRTLEATAIHPQLQPLPADAKPAELTKPSEPPSKPEPSTQPKTTASRFLVHGRRRHLAFGIVVFLVSMVAILTYVTVAITSTRANCAHLPQCRVMAYTWHARRDDADCSCVVFIDRDQAPRFYSDWINATDTTQALVEAAQGGHLKTVQIINRHLPELPVELASCKGLEQIILIYSKTQSLPTWMKDFHELHYIHVESDFINFPLHTLPLDLFSRMPQLRFIRFGGAAAVPVFPSLKGLHALATLVLSIPHGLTEIPNLDDLTSLKTLIIADTTHVTRLPSLHKLTNLKSFSLFRRNAVCCNGFITGTCDLTAYQCKPRVDEPTVVCEATRFPEEDRALVKSIGGFLCSSNLTSDVADSEPTRETTDDMCGGVMYTQCHMGNRRGICYNGRMQVIHCDVFGEYEAMRRLEIEHGVGVACDPEVEAWLGCKV